MISASLVPVFTFGETSVYHVLKPEPGSFWDRFQTVFRKFTRVTLIACYGKWLIFPLKLPIHTVGWFLFLHFLHQHFSTFNISLSLSLLVGSPIEVTKQENPSNEEIDKYLLITFSLQTHVLIILTGFMIFSPVN